jgi:phosphoglucosamine mutase
MGNLFGTDGIRGVANLPPMDSETALNLGRTLGYILKKESGRKRILIGKDTRISGYMLETALESGISSMGVDVMLVGPLPTPGVAFATRSMRADAGIMISASHNSFEDNGIKIFNKDGFKLPDEMENEIENLLFTEEVNKSRADSDKIGKAFRIDDAIGRYIVFLKNCVDKSISFDGLKLVVDAANGAAYKVAAQLFFELGAEVHMIADRPNGKNINLNCGSLHPEHLVAKVRELNFDIGLAFDGDADRIVICDEKGQIFDGDDILAMCALQMKEEGTLRGGGVVGTVMSNLGLENLLKINGIKFLRSNVGDRYVLSEMLSNGFNFGGEQSGHLIFLDDNTTGDGLLSALKVLSVMQRAKKKLSSFKGLFERYPQILINIPVNEKIPFEEVNPIMQSVLKAEKELGEEGRVLLRYSGTEKKARVMVECSNSNKCRAVADQLADVVRKSLS